MSIRAFVLYSIGLLCSVPTCRAQWTKLATDTLHRGCARSNYFLTPQIGFTYASGKAIGNDSLRAYGPAYLYRTTDGGASWRYIPMFDTLNSHIFKSPKVGSAIFQFYFVTPAHGYLAGSRGLFETTDTGATWHALLSGSYIHVHATDSTIYAIRNDSLWNYPFGWYSPGLLIYSHTQGATWDTVKGIAGMDFTKFWDGFAQQFGMIDLVGNKDGFVAAIYSDSVAPIHTKIYRIVYTTDDGASWQMERLNPTVPILAYNYSDPVNGFGIQALSLPHTTRLFLIGQSDTMPEEDEYTYQVWWPGQRSNETLHWESGLWPAGAACTIYVPNASTKPLASNNGLVRSLDGGNTWDFVGATNSTEIDDNDFPALAVVGYGAVVYSSAVSFNGPRNNLWKTTTGGDGTLSIAQLEPQLGFTTTTSSGGTDTLFADCDSGFVTIVYNNLRCAYTKFRTLSVEGLTDDQFVFVPTRHVNSIGLPDTTRLLLRGLSVGTHDLAIHMTFRDDEFVETDTTLRITAIVKTGAAYATVFINTMQISAAPSDTVLIPLSMGSSRTTDSLFIAGPSSANVEFTLNTNVLSPIDFVPAIAGVAGGPIMTTDTTADLTVNISGTLPIGRQTVIGSLRCFVAVSDSDRTTVRVNPSWFHSADIRCVSLLSLEDQGELVQVTPLCGVETLQQFMQSGAMPADMLVVRPNPATTELLVTFRNDLHTPIEFELVNQLGVPVGSGTVTTNEARLDASHLPNGIYYLRATSARAMASVTRKILIAK